MVEKIINKIQISTILFFFILILGLYIRIILSPLLIKGDLLVFQEWSESLFSMGFGGFYFREGWLYSSPTQPPLMMLLLWLSRWMYEHLYFLALAHNYISLPPASVLIWLRDYGEIFFLRIWAFIADFTNAFLIYFLIKHVTGLKKIAVIGSAFYFLNPVTIFDSAVWGQTDLLAPLFALTAFYIFQKRFGKLLSPIIFTAGILIKPTVVILAPFYLVFVIRELLFIPQKERLTPFFSLLAGVFLSALITLELFVPFSDRTKDFFPYVESIVVTRMLPSAKGVTRASNSAFNAHSLLFSIDKTLGSQKLGFFTVNQIGLLSVIILQVIVMYLWLTKYGSHSKFILLNMLLFIYAEGWFLFQTGMSERYFLVAFFPLVFLLFSNYEVKLLILAILVQNIVWFMNMFYSFFRRDFSSLAGFFENNNYLVIRALSFINILVFFYIVTKFLQIISKERKYK